MVTTASFSGVATGVASGHAEARTGDVRWVERGEVLSHVRQFRRQSTESGDVPLASRYVLGSVGHLQVGDDEAHDVEAGKRGAKLFGDEVIDGGCFVKSDADQESCGDIERPQKPSDAPPHHLTPMEDMPAEFDCLSAMHVRCAGRIPQRDASLWAEIDGEGSRRSSAAQPTVQSSMGNNGGIVINREAIVTAATVIRTDEAERSTLGIPSEGEVGPAENRKSEMKTEGDTFGKQGRIPKLKEMRTVKESTGTRISLNGKGCVAREDEGDGALEGKLQWECEQAFLREGKDQTEQRSITIVYEEVKQRGNNGDESSEDEEYNLSVKTDHYGFFVTSERHGPDLSPLIARRRRLKECSRADKWRIMLENLENWVKGKQFKHLQSRVRKGVPDCVRGEVWQRLSGSKAMMQEQPDKYAELLSSNLPVEGPIEEDIPRTMYDHEMFCSKSRIPGRHMLRRVLTAYGRYDREVQYCQGMNYICALFLLYMPEENAFWLMVASMQRPRAPLRQLFLPGMLKAQEIQDVVDSLTAKYCKSLYTQLVQNNLTPAMYATQWFLTAFTQRFRYDLVTRVWDMFLLEDFKTFYRVCLALFKSVEDEVSTYDLEKLNVTLRNMPTKLDTDEILRITSNIPLKHRHIDKRTAQFYAGRDLAGKGDSAVTGPKKFQKVGT